MFSPILGAKIQQPKGPNKIFEGAGFSCDKIILSGPFEIALAKLLLLATRASQILYGLSLLRIVVVTVLQDLGS